MCSDGLTVGRARREARSTAASISRRWSSARGRGSAPCRRPRRPARPSSTRSRRAPGRGRWRSRGSARCRVASASACALLDDLVGRGLRLAPRLVDQGTHLSSASATSRRCSASSRSASFRAASVSCRTCSRCSSRWCRAVSSGFQANRPSTSEQADEDDHRPDRQGRLGLEDVGLRPRPRALPARVAFVGGGAGSSAPAAAGRVRRSSRQRPRPDRGRLRRHASGTARPRARARINCRGMR